MKKFKLIVKFLGKDAFETEFYALDEESALEMVQKGLDLTVTKGDNEG